MVRRGSAPAMSSTAPPSRAATIWEPCSAAEVLAATAWITARARTARLRGREAGQEGNKDMSGWLTVLVVLAVLALIGLALSVRIVQQYEKGVLFRLGRVVGVREPGLPQLRAGVYDGDTPRADRPLIRKN